MKSGYAVLLILLLAAVLTWGIVFLSTHDRVAEVVDVSTLRLQRGRTVYLIGVESSAIYGFGSAAIVGEEPLADNEVDNSGETVNEFDGSVLEVVVVDTEATTMIAELVTDQWIKLEFSDAFEPDTASPELHAYIRLKDGTDLNGWIISSGLAEVEKSHSHPRGAEYMILEEQARNDRLGIWSWMEIH